MEIRYLNQPKDVKLGDILNEQFSSGNNKRIWVIAGFAKDAGLDCIYAGIENSIVQGATIKIVIGVDKKNTSKDMIQKLVNLGCEVMIHINEENEKFETRIYAFEKENGEAYIYQTAAKLSEGGLYENKALITEIKYKDEEKNFSKFIMNLENGFIEGSFKEATPEYLMSLAKTGEIIARITERAIPKISEMYKTSEIEIGTKLYSESSASVINKELITKDIDIAIDIDEPKVKMQKSFGEEVENVITKKKNTHKEENKEETIVTTKIVLDESMLNYKEMTTLVIETNQVMSKGPNEGEIKIPQNIAKNMKEFLDYPENFHIEEDEKGKLKETAHIKLKIYNSETKKEENDEDAQMYQTEKHIAIKSRKAKELQIEEGDIIRLIKEEKGKYTCEIFKKASPEYEIWQGFCTRQIKGTKRKYGIS